MAVDGALGEQTRLANIAGVSPVGRSGADLQRDSMLVQAGEALTSGKGGADLQQLVNSNIAANVVTITDIDPATDVAAGGATITITGTGFIDVLAVLFDGITGENLTVNSATEIEVDAPAHGAGNVDLTVTTEHGFATEVDGFEYTA